MKVTDEGVPVEALISVVKDSIKRAGISRTSQDRDLQVASVQLILDVVAAKTAGGGLDFRVPFIGMKLRVGGKVTSKDTHTIDITLVPPEERATRQVRGGDVEEVLVNAIATVRAVVAEAAAGDDPWVLSASTIDIRFAITRDRNHLPWRRRRTGERGHPDPAPWAGTEPRMSMALDRGSRRAVSCGSIAERRRRGRT